MTETVTYRCSRPPDTPIAVYESPDTGLCDIPADLARVNTATARHAVIEYVASGQRPTNVTWVYEELPTP